jgi:hypothetical protein
MAMSPYSRPAKVLMYLVVSMTAATTLLLLMEHWVAPPGMRDLPLESLGPVAQAVNDHQTDRLENWDEIVISYRDRMAKISPVALAATGQRLPYHFVIEPNGEVFALPAWRDQEPDVSGGGVVTRAVRVCLAGEPDTSAVSADQWNALVNLLRQVRLHCGLSTKAIRLDPQSDSQFRPDVSPQADCLRKMLLAADIID